MQDFLFKNFIMSWFYKYKKQNRLKYYQELRKRDLLTFEELIDIQTKGLKKLLDHCYTNIPYYRNLFNELDIHPEDIKDLKDYSKIPELRKQNIRDDFSRLIDPRLSKSKICYSATGGSTGIPLKIYKSTEDQERGFALRYRSNAWCGWETWNKSLWIVSDLKRLGELDNPKRRLGLWFKRRLLLDTKNYTNENMYKWIEQIKIFKPRYVYGYSTLLTEFSEFLVKNNISIEGIEGVFSTAEPLIARETMSKAFNAPVYDQYGSSEVPCIAHECKRGNMHINIDEILLEFVDTKGCPELKKIVCTPLYIYGMPLLRYNLGDCAIPSLKKCDCGLPYPVMELKVGRLADNFLSPIGKLVATCNLGWHITHITQDIKQYQIIQQDLSDFVVKLVSSEEVREANESSLRTLLYGLLGTTQVNIRFEYLDEILPGSNGKYRATISKVVDNFNKGGTRDFFNSSFVSNC
ncbi:MAG: hypothetical protein A2287_10995 [Candidatus Melainabacteria bacterium RIFOXYA12_FULL_32_12]|nr:MAG: hypothetical protein A2255_10175 [Candidatus Melainabacteria bacterium RIFOXYA2_FULL_32_9]OGI31890.1 MAG: hypothetical protein A2287_10995 [Candidatus Melainabacteria bacterium RIFOXYA12_FULL_32_12]